jgi:hypothetical protein
VDQAGTHLYPLCMIYIFIVQGRTPHSASCAFKGSSPFARIKGCDNLYAYIIDASCSWVGFQSRSVTVTLVSFGPGQPKFLIGNWWRFCGRQDAELTPLILVRESGCHLPIIQIFLWRLRNATLTPTLRGKMSIHSLNWLAPKCRITVVARQPKGQWLPRWLVSLYSCWVQRGFLLP